MNYKVEREAEREAGSSDFAESVRENVLLNKKHILLYDDSLCLEDTYRREFDYITKNFCGVVCSDLISFTKHRHTTDTILYLCGDIMSILTKIDLKYSKFIEEINVIKDFSTNYYDTDAYNLIGIGEVPINIFNVGVYFRNFFDPHIQYYETITSEHEFQNLGMVDKAGFSHRKGIYMTSVKTDHNNDNNDDNNNDNTDLRFRLLRCSTNLSGPTDNFRDIDNYILNKVNGVCEYFYEDNVKLNHVLAQTYHNVEVLKEIDNNTASTAQAVKKKGVKAKISEHSDKTKDMPKNALMAFASFYKDYSVNGFNYGVNLSKSEDMFDYVYNNHTSVLTKLRFRLKPEVEDETYVKFFDITLYPNSVFIMSLKSNRLYTHEIVPSSLDIDKIPTRMGYVIRTSNTEAIHKDGQTYVLKNNRLIKLDKPTQQGIEKLKQMYLIENKTTQIVDYDDKFYFSLNNGDYMKPIS